MKVSKKETKKERMTIDDYLRVWGHAYSTVFMNDLGLVRRYSFEDHNCNILVISLKFYLLRDIFTFCNVLHVWACPGHPHL